MSSFNPGMMKLQELYDDDDGLYYLYGLCNPFRRVP